jgi:hypothetical protein
MKELIELAHWADNLIAESVRPLPSNKGRKHIASVQYPDLPPEQAAMAYLADKISDSGKIDHTVDTATNIR